MMKKLGSVLFALALVSGCDGDDGPALGGVGESCAKRADCAGGLACFNGVCRETVDAGAGPDGSVPVQGPALGQRGETCQVAADCDQGLTCVPEVTGNGAIGLGRCDLASYGLKPTGKTCSAECKAAVDCCELPVGVIASDKATVINSCADLVKLLGDPAGSCESTAPSTLVKECLLYKAYCECAEGTWACNSGQCSYTRNCQSDGETVKGCPAQSRSGLTLPTHCDTPTSKCVYATVTPDCKTADECVGKSVAGDTSAVSELCVTGECVCVGEPGKCYRKCNDDLDCETGFACDMTKKVCAKIGECDNDAFCAKTIGNVTAKCVEKVCKLPCISDHDCSPSGIDSSSKFTGEVCSEGYCTSLGCSSDLECSSTANSKVKMFCAAPIALPATVQYRSAITY